MPQANGINKLVAAQLSSAAYSAVSSNRLDRSGLHPIFLGFEHGVENG